MMRNMNHSIIRTFLKIFLLLIIILSFNSFKCIHPEESPYKILFATSQNLYSMKIDGSNVKHLFYDFDGFTDINTDVYNTFIIYRSSYIKKISVTGQYLGTIPHTDSNTQDITISADNKLLYRKNGTGLFIMELDGTNNRQITKLTTDYLPSASPASNKIVFSDINDYHIMIINRDGTERRILYYNNILNNDSADNPSFSPDGSKIVFELITDPGPGQVNHIVVMNSDGSEIKKIVQDTTYTLRSPKWSPDGTKICYNRNGYLWIINADGTGKKQISTIIIDHDKFTFMGKPK